jgi:swainsonine biosynthesis oxidoreductase SwnR
MKVAIAGTSQITPYLTRALLSAGHDVLILTRHQPQTPLPVPHAITDYNVPSLITALSDRDALISTVISYTNPSINTSAHLAMLSALTQSPACKTFIPSEFTCDVLNYPDQPMFNREHTRVLHAALRQAKAEHGLRYTVVCNSWFMDYVLPADKRGLRDIGPAWPMDHATHTFTVYDSGEKLMSFVALADVAHAVERLISAVDVDRHVEWDEYTFLEGERLSWKQVFELVDAHARRQGGDQAGWAMVKKPLSETIDQLVQAEKDGNPFGAALAHMELMSYSGASLLPWSEVQRQREKWFAGVKFRTMEEVLSAGNETIVE